MASEIRVTNIKANDGTASLTVANSTGNVAVGGTLTSTGAITASGGITNAGTISAGTIGGSVIFPAGHIVQSVLNPTISGASNTNHFTSEGVAAQLDGQITITSGNGVLIYFFAMIFLDRNTDEMGFLMKLREGLTTSGALITDHQERHGSGHNQLLSRGIWGFDASPASTTPDYCITLQRYTSGVNFVEINDTSSQFLKAFLFEVKQ